MWPVYVGQVYKGPSKSMKVGGLAVFALGPLTSHLKILVLAFGTGHIFWNFQSLKWPPIFGCPRSTGGSFPHTTELLPFSRGEPLRWSHWDDLSCHVIWNFIHWNSLLMLTPGLALNNVDFHTSQLIILIYICMLKLTLHTCIHSFTRDLSRIRPRIIPF